MATLRDTRVDCDRCQWPTLATHTLVGVDGRLRGEYCWRHAQAALIELEATEAQIAEYERAHTLHRAPGVGGD